MNVRCSRVCCTLGSMWLHFLMRVGLFLVSVQRVEECVLVYGNALWGHVPGVYVFFSGGCVVCLSVRCV